MDRIALTGEDAGKWFDKETAIHFDEQTRWDGRNRISVATGSQWEHETLYYTRSGRWVLYHCSQWQGSLPSYSEIGAAAAARWVIANGLHDRRRLRAVARDGPRRRGGADCRAGGVGRPEPLRWVRR